MLYFSLLNVLNTKLITHQLRFVLVYRYLAEQQQDDRLVMCNINVYAIKRYYYHHHPLIEYNKGSSTSASL